MKLCRLLTFTCPSPASWMAWLNNYKIFYANLRKQTKTTALHTKHTIIKIEMWIRTKEFLLFSSRFFCKVQAEQILVQVYAICLNIIQRRSLAEYKTFVTIFFKFPFCKYFLSWNIVANVLFSFPNNAFFNANFWYCLGCDPLAYKTVSCYFFAGGTTALSLAHLFSSFVCWYCLLLYFVTKKIEVGESRTL